MTGQNDRQDRSLTGQVRDQAGHCPLTGRYLQPCDWHKTATSLIHRIADPHRSSVKVSEHCEQRLHTLYMQGKSTKPKILVYTYWNLSEADNSNSYKTPHHKHWSTVRISERLRDCSTLLFWKIGVISNKNLTSWSSILDHLSWRLDPRILRLDPCISKLRKFELRDMRIESQVASFECQLTFQPYCISFLVVSTLIQYDNVSP